MHLWTGIYIVCLVLPLSSAIQFRYIFTLFKTKKTWNEAKQICNDQQGQLVKLKDITDTDNGIIDEMKYLDQTEWLDTIANGDGFWTGLHKDNITGDMWKYDDCEEYGTNNANNLSMPSSSFTPCVLADSGYVLNEVPCTETHQFVCQRYLGDCWYEPFLGEQIVGGFGINQSASVEPSDCARQCNKYHKSDNDCWAFTYLPGIADGLCNFDHTASSVFYLDPATREVSTFDDAIVYVRRCFEGLVDTLAYNKYTNTDTEPLSECSNKTYDGGPVVQDNCFCSTEDKPPIPAPISNDEAVENLIRELSIDTGNTSSALRKLTSAEDNRPSAIGVGFVGVGLLSGIFGTLLLLDMGRFVRGVKALFQSPEDAESQNQN